MEGVNSTVEVYLIRKETHIHHIISAAFMYYFMYNVLVEIHNGIERSDREDLGISRDFWHTFI